MKQDIDLQDARRRKADLSPNGTGKRQPHDIPAEQGVLGSILIGGSETFAEVAAIIQEADYFFDLRHRTIFEACRSLFMARIPIDLIVLQAALKKADSLSMCGGLPYLSELPNKSVSPENWEYYADIVIDKWFRRTIIDKCQRAINVAATETEESDDIMVKLERDVLSIGDGRRGCKSVHTASEITSQYRDNLEKGWINGRISYRTGFRDLDGILGDIRGGQMIVLAATPATGKSSLAANIVANHCSHGTPIGVVTMEMSAAEWMEQIYSIETGVSARTLELGGFDDEAMSSIGTILGKIERWPLHIMDDGKKTIEQIEAQARQWVSKYSIKILVIDFLQAIQVAAGKKYENRNSLVTHISNATKAMAKDLDIPVIVLASMNRESRRNNTKPQPWEIRDSGSIESDADKIILLHPHKDDLIECIVAKNRTGPAETAILRFIKKIRRFENEE